MTLQISEPPCPADDVDAGELTNEMRISRRRMLQAAAVSLGAIAAGPVAEAAGGHGPKRPSTACPRASRATSPT